MTNESRFLDIKLRYIMVRSFTLLLGIFLSASLFAHQPALLVGPNAITLDFSKVEPTCHGYTNATATVTPTGGVAPYGYAWNNGQMGPTNLGITAGTYTVTVTDNTGETTVGSVTLNEPAQVTASFAPYTSNCGGFMGPLVTNVTGGVGTYSYAWSTGETTSSITNLGNDTYYVTVTDGQGCSAILAEYIAGGGMTLNPTINRPTCNGNTNGSISVNILGSNPPFTYTWANGTSNQPLTNIGAGTYALTLSDGSGCTQATNVYIYDNAPLTLLVEKEDAVCFMACDGVVKVNAMGGLAPYTYTWSNGFQGGPINTSLQPGWYYLTVTDASGCSKVDSAFIYEPPAIKITSTTINGACGGNTGSATVSASGGTAPFTYAWNYNNTSGPTLSNAPAGTYVVLVTDKNGCQKDTMVTIGGTAGLNVAINVGSALCVGVNTGTASATVLAPFGSGNYSYAWNVQPGINAPNINNLSAGSNVAVTVTDMTSGCQGVATANISGHTKVQVLTTDGFVTCSNNPTGTVTATATNGAPPYSYVWANGSTAQSLSNLTAGAYGLTVTDANGCTAPAAANVAALSDLNAAFQPNVLGCVNNQVQINLNDASTDANSTITAWNWNIAWSLGTTQSTDQNPGTLTLPENETATIQLTVTSAQGCTNTTSQLYTVGGLPNVSLSASNPAVSCNGSPVAVQVTSNAGSNYTYTWSPSNGVTQNGSPTNVSLDPNQSLQYSLAVANGSCVKNLDVNLVMPAPLNLQAPNQVMSCKSNEMLTATTSVMAEFVWTDANGATLQTNNGTQLSELAVTPSGTATYTVTAKDQYGCTATKTVTVSGDALDISLTPGVSVNDCQNTPIAISYTNNDPTDQLTATWISSNPALVIANPNAVSTNISGPMGSYTVSLVATNQSGCKDTLDIAVDYNGLDLNLTPGASVNGCENTPLAISYTNNNPSDQITATWTSSNPNLTIANPSAATTNVNGPMGTYTVSLFATNQSGCKDTFDIAVTYTEGSVLDPLVSLDLCKGLDVAFGLNSTVDGTWNFGDTNSSGNNTTTHTYATAGTYSVSFVPNAACVATYEADITVAAAPAVNVLFDHNLVDCEDVAKFNFFSLATTTDPVANYTWSINGIDSSSLKNPSMVFNQIGPISVTLIVEDVNGCIDSLNKSLPFHIVSEDVTAAQSICAPGEVALNPTFNPVYDYAWTATPVDANLDATNPNPTVSPTQNTTYSLIVTWGGCQVTKVVDLKYSPEADLALIGNTDITTCDATPVTLTANSVNGTIEWADNPLFASSTLSDTYIVTPIRFGTYFVRSVTGPGCEKMDTVKIHNGAVDVSFDNDLVACKGADVQLEVMNNIMDDQLTYAWNNGLASVNNPIAQPNVTTTYTGIVGNDYGCFDTAKIEVKVIELVLAGTSSSDTICPDQSATLTINAVGSANYTYQWEPTLYVLSGEQEAVAVVSPPETTTFTVTVTDENGCKESAAVNLNLISISCKFPYIFIPKAFTPNGDGENENFMVRGHNITDLYFVVYDRWGEEMYKTQDPQALGWDGMYKGRKLSPDSYGWYVRLRCDDGAEYIDKGNVTLLK